MAGAQRTANDPVVPVDPTTSPLHQEVLANATRWDFFVTVGMLERLTPDAIRIGGDGPAQGEAIRFHHDPSLAFSAGDISGATYEMVPRGPQAALDKKQFRYHLTTTFLGLTGSSSPLPLFMSEEIAQLQDAANLRREFLDLFHHRFVSFVFRIGVKYDIAREFSLDCTDPWTDRKSVV